jgi:hypothetical protein
MFKILVIQATNSLSDERTEFLINDRLSFMRFLGPGFATVFCKRPHTIAASRTFLLGDARLTRPLRGTAQGPFERADQRRKYP